MPRLNKKAVTAYSCLETQLDQGVIVAFFSALQKIVLLIRAYFTRHGSTGASQFLNLILERGWGLLVSLLYLDFKHPLQ